MATVGKIDAKRKLFARVFAWMASLAFIASISTTLYMVSYGGLVAYDNETLQSERLKLAETRAREEVRFNEESGKSALEKARAMKELAIYYQESRNFAAARDTLLSAEKLVALEYDDVDHLLLRIDLKRQAAVVMCDCTLFQEAEPLFRQAGRIVSRLEAIDKDAAGIAKAKLLNDEGVMYYLWAGSTRELAERGQRYEVAADCFLKAGKILSRSSIENPSLKVAIADNLRQLRDDQKYEKLTYISQ
ncbi:MAG: hypothetical protein JNN26_03350 [Candidatus Obscuribacter sp.]|nr:hypothetical protein [Candidatus Obscuribacter sp.]